MKQRSLGRTGIDDAEGTGVHMNFAPSWFDPKFEFINSRVSYVPGIKVVRGATQTIVPWHKSHVPNGSLLRYNNGDLQVHDRRSSDGGQTWLQVEYILDPTVFQFPEPDGEVLMFRLEREDLPKRIQKLPGRDSMGSVPLRLTQNLDIMEATLCRSHDQGVTWTDGVAVIHMPEELRGCSPTLCRKIVGLADGNLLTTLYSAPSGDPADGFNTCVIRSKDRGKTWHFLSTVASGKPSKFRSEGFNEATLLVLPDDRIQCFVRSGANYQASLGSHDGGDKNAKMPFFTRPQTPLYLCESDDGGHTWSQAEPVAPFGVWPDAAKLSNGITAVVYGRPGNWLMFSADDGLSWGPVFEFYNDLYPPDAGNYCALAEVAPEVVLVTYARTDPNDHWQNEIVGTYFRVTRSSIEESVTPESPA